MQVKELIEKLKTMPQDAEVKHLWDGDPRTTINFVWLSKGGVVITADYDEVCYSGINRPRGAPSSGEDLYWSTPTRTVWHDF